MNYGLNLLYHKIPEAKITKISSMKISQPLLSILFLVHDAFQPFVDISQEKKVENFVLKFSYLVI